MSKLAEIGKVVNDATDEFKFSDGDFGVYIARKVLLVLREPSHEMWDAIRCGEDFPVGMIPVGAAWPLMIDAVLEGK